MLSASRSICHAHHHDARPVSSSSCSATSSEQQRTLDDTAPINSHSNETQNPSHRFQFAFMATRVIAWRTRPFWRRTEATTSVCKYSDLGDFLQLRRLIQARDSSLRSLTGVTDSLLEVNNPYGRRRCTIWVPQRYSPRQWIVSARDAHLGCRLSSQRDWGTYPRRRLLPPEGLTWVVDPLHLRDSPG